MEKRILSDMLSPPSRPFLFQALAAKYYAKNIPISNNLKFDYNSAGYIFFTGRHSRRFNEKGMIWEKKVRKYR